MTIENARRAMAGILVRLRVALAHLGSPWWLLFTAFVGVNRRQSGVTRGCPLVWILERAGLRHVGAPGATGR